ncbi:MAG: hypothetical protein ABIQ11_03185, partial [Saprospiraceae bacterium]
IENVVQFNWMYTGDGSAPYGVPVEEQCITLECAPTIVCAADVTISCGESTIPDSTGLAIATDICPGDIVITIDDTILVLICPGNFVILRTFIATNDCNLADTCTQSITVIDTIAPTLICTGDTIIDCPQEPDFPLPIATDQCDTSVMITFTDNQIPGQCPAAYTVTRTWIATDDCGNSTTCDVTIVVQDTIPPELDCPDDVTLDCTASTLPNSTVPGTATAADDCDSILLVLPSDVTMGSGGCPQEYTIFRTWTATDDCGNTGTCIQTISVQDNTPPVITCPADMTLDCGETIPNDPIAATDDCSGIDSTGFSDIVCDNPVIGFSGPYDFTNWTVIIPPQGGSVTTMGDSEVMLVGPDDSSCTNASTLFQIIIPSTGQLVFDWNYSTSDIDGPSFDPFCYNLNGTFFQLTNNIGPNIQSGTASVLVTAGDVFAFEQRSVDCIFGAGATTVVEFYACIEQDEEACTQLIIRTHVAIDSCGNEANCIQTILIIDTIPPDIACPADTIVDCSSATDTLTLGGANASDACYTTLLVTYTDSIIPGSCPAEFTI